MTTSPTRSSAGLEHRRRRILFRAHHRGTRELDLLLGRFADVFVEDLSEAELDEFERLLDAPEPELMSWLIEGQPIPEEYDTDLFAKLLAFIRTPKAKPLP